MSGTSTEQVRAKTTHAATRSPRRSKAARRPRPSADPSRAASSPWSHLSVPPRHRTWTRLSGARKSAGLPESAVQVGDAPCKLTRSKPIKPSVRPAKTPPSSTSTALSASFHQKAAKPFEREVSLFEPTSYCEGWTPHLMILVLSLAALPPAAKPPCPHSLHPRQRQPPGRHRSAQPGGQAGRAVGVLRFVSAFFVWRPWLRVRSEVEAREMEVCGEVGTDDGVVSGEGAGGAQTVVGG